MNMILPIVFGLIASVKSELTITPAPVCITGTTASNTLVFEYACDQEGQFLGTLRVIACIAGNGTRLLSGQTYSNSQFEYICTIDDVGKTASFTIDACYTPTGTRVAVGYSVNENGYTYSCTDNLGNVVLTVALTATTGSTTVTSNRPRGKPTHNPFRRHTENPTGLPKPKPKLKHHKSRSC